MLKNEQGAQGISQNFSFLMIISLVLITKRFIGGDEPGAETSARMEVARDLGGEVTELILAGFTDQMFVAFQQLGQVVGFQSAINQNFFNSFFLCT